MSLVGQQGFLFLLESRDVANFQGIKHGENLETKYLVPARLEGAGHVNVSQDTRAKPTKAGQ